MMSTITLAGTMKQALTHFALLGLAKIAETAYPGKVRLWWSTDAIPRAHLSVEGADVEDLARLVRNLATDWSKDQAWPQIRRDYHHGKATSVASPFSPRIKAIDAVKNPDEWKGHQDARIKVLDVLDAERDWLSLELISALGEPAYWRQENKDPRPDHGASRWEMKTRNRGEEFVSQRFGPLCREVAEWDFSAISAGLSGEILNDSIGKNASNSRTSTGLTPPGPVDVAVAFVALVGIAAFPMARHTHRINATPGAFPATRLHPSVMVLPMPTTPVTPSRMGGIIESEELGVITVREGTRMVNKEKEGVTIHVTQAAAWLRSRQVPAVTVFPVLLGGSSSAPERQVLNGELRLL